MKCQLTATVISAMLSVAAVTAAAASELDAGPGFGGPDATEKTIVKDREP